MSRSVLLTGLAMIFISSALFVWKAVVLDLPIAPSGGQGLWRVELDVQVRGSGERGSIRVPLPSSGTGQVVYDERMQSDRLLFSIRTEEEQRTGVWSGRFDGVHELAHGFRVQLEDVSAPIVDDGRPPPPEVASHYTSGVSGTPDDAILIARLFEQLALPAASDIEGRLRSLFSFVVNDLDVQPTASDDALLALSAREGSAIGITRALVVLLRHAGIPARVVLGLRLRPDAPPDEVVWAQAWVGSAWVPLSPTEEFFGSRRADRVALQYGSTTGITSHGVAALGHRYHGLRETLRQDELAALMVPQNAALSATSLYRLPVSTQAALRGLLLLPLGALLMALIRNLVGVPTFGTFMPILIAFVLRGYSLGPGLALVFSVLAVGIIGRLALDRLHLLLVPRLSILLCGVVLVVTVAALFARGSDMTGFFAGVLFPMVILTMLIERFSVALAEEGWRPALERAGWSLGAIVLAHPLFRSDLAEHLMFGFPELVLGVMGLLVLLGGYTGYRAMDLVRFRAFADFRPGQPR